MEAMKPRLVRPMAMRQRAQDVEMKAKRPTKVKADAAEAPETSRSVNKDVFVLVTKDGEQKLAFGMRAEILLTIRDNPKATYNVLYLAIGVQETTSREYCSQLMRAGLVTRVLEPEVPGSGSYKLSKYSLADGVVVGDKLTVIKK